MPTVKQQVQTVSNNLAAILANWAEEPDVVTPPVVVPGVEKDPRSARGRSFATAGDKVTGVKLIWKSQPETRFRLVDFDIFNEDESKGATNTIVHVLRWVTVGGQKVLIPARARAYLAWPGVDPENWEGQLVPGNVSYPYDHITQSEYVPPKTGPLTLFIGDDHGGVDSDLAGGIGLPSKHHICFWAVFQERER